MHLMQVKEQKPRYFYSLLEMKIFAPIIAALTPASAWAADAPSEPYNWGPQMMWGGGWYAMILGPLFMVLVLAVVIGTAVLVVRSLSRPWQGAPPPPYPPPGRTPLDILKERFARGEIDKDEFEARRRVLGD